MSDTAKSYVARFLLFCACVTAGALIWICSPSVTGYEEPWDDDGLFYQGCLLATGLLAGMLIPRPFLLWAAGVWLGQAIGFLCHVLLDQRAGALWLVGFVIFLPLTSLWSFCGAFLGAVAHLQIVKWLPSAKQ